MLNYSLHKFLMLHKIFPHLYKFIFANILFITLSYIKIKLNYCIDLFLCVLI
jgi:hypothetical protein